ncbi:universal stress protein [Nocardioides sp. Root140]|uniref:universal stress protein n=1 Tax=Nocardioides sp. Root140 TaxID=1736460 RepID=UPI0009EBD0A1|nr:universal stress protein [Nocardioides sp. Root140]
MRSHRIRRASVYAADQVAESRDRVCLVAVDGSDASVQCLVWALHHAAVHQLTVEVVTIWPSRHSVFVHEVAGHFSAPRWKARDAQREVIRKALAQVPRGSIHAARLENGRVVDSIVHASARCELVVLGAASGDEPHPLTTRVTEQAECQVVVVDRAGEVQRPTSTGRSPLSTTLRTTAR